MVAISHKAGMAVDLMVVAHMVVAEILMVTALELIC